MLKRTKAKVNNTHGFTLVELLVTLIILGVVAAFTVPSLVGYITRGKNDTVVVEAHAAVAAAQTMCSSKYQAGGFDDPGLELRKWYGGSDAPLSAGSPNRFPEEYYVLSDSDTPGTGSIGGSTALTDVNALLFGGAAQADSSNQVSGKVIDFLCSDDGKVTWLVYQSGNITVVYSAGGGTTGGTTPAPAPTAGPIVPLPVEVTPSPTPTASPTPAVTATPKPDETKEFTLIDDRPAVTVTVKVTAKKWPALADVSDANPFSPVPGTFYYYGSSLYYCSEAINAPMTNEHNYQTPDGDWYKPQIHKVAATTPSDAIIYTEQTSVKTGTSTININTGDFYITDSKTLYYCTSGGQYTGIPSAAPGAWRSPSSSGYTATIVDNTVDVNVYIVSSGVKPADDPAANVLKTSGLSGISVKASGTGLSAAQTWTSAAGKSTKLPNVVPGGDVTIAATHNDIYDSLNVTFQIASGAISVTSGATTDYIIDGTNLYLICRPHLFTAAELNTLPLYKTDQFGTNVAGASLEVHDTTTDAVLFTLTSAAGHDGIFAGSSSVELAAGVRYRLHESVVPTDYAQAEDIYFSLSADKNGAPELHVSSTLHGSYTLKDADYMVDNKSVTIDTSIKLSYTGSNNVFLDREVAFIRSSRTEFLKTMVDGKTLQEALRPDNYQYIAPATVADIFKSVQVKVGSTVYTYTANDVPGSKQFTAYGIYNSDAVGSYTISINLNGGKASTLTVKIFDFQDFSLSVENGRSIVFPYTLDWDFYDTRLHDNNYAASLHHSVTMVNDGTFYVALNEPVTVKAGQTYDDMLINFFTSFGPNPLSYILSAPSSYYDSTQTIIQHIPAYSLRYDNGILYGLRNIKDATNQENPGKQLSANWIQIKTWAWKISEPGNIKFSALMDGSDNTFLTGLQYSLTDDEGNPVGQFTTQSTAYEFSLEAGKTYTLNETSRPSSFERAEGAAFPLTFTVAADATTTNPQEIKMHYTPYLIVTNTVNDQPLQGAQLRMDRMTIETFDNSAHEKPSASRRIGSGAESVWDSTIAGKRFKIVPAGSGDYADDGELQLQLNQPYYLSESGVPTGQIAKSANFCFKPTVTAVGQLVLQECNISAIGSTTVDVDNVLSNKAIRTNLSYEVTNALAPNLNAAGKYLYNALYAAAKGGNLTATIDVNSHTRTELEALLTSAGQPVNSTLIDYLYSGVYWRMDLMTTDGYDGVYPVDSKNRWRLWLFDTNYPTYLYYYIATSDGTGLCQRRVNPKLTADPPSKGDTVASQIGYSSGWFQVEYTP